MRLSRVTAKEKHKRLTGDRYQDFLINVLPTLLEYVPCQQRLQMWFMHNGTPAHFNRNVREHLTLTFQDLWIDWPARLRNLNLLYFSLCVDGIDDIEMVFGEMRPRIRHRLPDICLTVGENLGNNPTRCITQMVKGLLAKSAEQDSGYGLCSEIRARKANRLLKEEFEEDEAIIVCAQRSKQLTHLVAESGVANT
ncbi:hypothetical protein ANN_14198 [Periplaneta americana]|uniref:Uncharacterized protein n=1 Tax=Periplaneta americana TaxID=6978 RepID=A0ABQ8SWP7_PERAM|nr:hypothetical protein ANN_14198 [Periplaneta americana]